MASQALSHLLEAWSRWASRLLDVIAKQAQVPDHELPQPRVSEESYWLHFREAAGVVVEAFVKKYAWAAVLSLCFASRCGIVSLLRIVTGCRGLAACARREDAEEIGAGGACKEDVFRLRTGSQLHDFLNSLSVLSSLNLTRSLSEASSGLRELWQRQREQRTAAAAAATDGDQQRVVLHLKSLKETQLLEHWLMLYIQFLVASVQNPRGLTPKIIPSKELLQDTSAQTEVGRRARKV